jgi:hypothetical protein
MFYNTNNTTGDALIEEQNNTLTQSAIVTKLYEEAAQVEYTACEIHKMYPNHDMVPLTSIRRAISDLEREGILVKTDITRIGIYGKHVHTWKLNHLYISKKAA